MSGLLAAIFPATCPGCGRAGEPVCSACAAELHAPPPAPPPAGVDAWAAPFAYEGVARELVARAKYRGAHASLGWLADAMIDALPAHEAGADVVTWAPTTRERRRDRGFDHAELLARAVARRLRVPARPTLTRAAGAAQTGQSASARRVGPRFEPVGRGAARVLLVDDVATTGATLAAAARALREAGAIRVSAVCGARTPAPGRGSVTRAAPGARVV